MNGLARALDSSVIAVDRTEGVLTFRRLASPKKTCQEMRVRTGT